MKRLIFYLCITALLFITFYFLFKDLFICIYSGLAVSVIMIFIEISGMIRNSNNKRKALYIFAAIAAVGGFTLTNIGMHFNTNLQKKLLLKTGAIINEGELNVKLTDAAFKIFKQYSVSGNNSMSEAFNAFYKTPPKVPGVIDTIFVPNEKGKFLCILYLTKINEEEIIVTGRGPYLKGLNKEFVNVDGSIGLVQSKIIINSKGVFYESEN